MSAAQVHAIERLAEFKAALQTFADRGKDAMAGNSMEIRRSLDWAETQLALWKGEIRRAEDDVIKARNELARKKMMRIGDRQPDTTFEEKTLRKAKARLEHAEEKRDNAKRWLRELPDAIEEYNGHAGPFQDALDHDLARMIAFLEQKIAALEEYQRIQGAPGGTP
jgi:chromosome segregation ATPase